MAVVATEGALDLSSKQPLEIKPHSPAPSITSDTDSQGCEVVAEPARERSESVSSDGHETDSSTTTAVKPILGHGQTGLMPNNTETMVEKKVLESQNSNITHMNNNPYTSPSSVRPFKMYPFDPMPGLYSQMAAAATTASPGLFPMAATTAMPLGGMMDTGSVSLSSPIMSYLHSRKRRTESRSSTESLSDAKKLLMAPDESKDGHYWERRRKNNEAAKRSRDARRCKEEEIALRAAFLEQENLKLRAQVAILKNETAKLHYMLYNRM